MCREATRRHRGDGVREQSCRRPRTGRGEGDAPPVAQQRIASRTRQFGARATRSFETSRCTGSPRTRHERIRRSCRPARDRHNGRRDGDRNKRRSAAGTAAEIRAAWHRGGTPLDHRTEPAGHLARRDGRSRARDPPRDPGAALPVRRAAPSAGRTNSPAITHLGGACASRVPGSSPCDHAVPADHQPMHPRARCAGRSRPRVPRERGAAGWPS